MSGNNNCQSPCLSHDLGPQIFSRFGHAQIQESRKSDRALTPVSVFFGCFANHFLAILSTHKEDFDPAAGAPLLRGSFFVNIKKIK